MKYSVYWTLIESLRCNVAEKYTTYFKTASLSAENLQALADYLNQIKEAVEFLEKEPKTPTEE